MYLERVKTRYKQFNIAGGRAIDHKIIHLFEHAERDKRDKLPGTRPMTSLLSVNNVECANVIK